MNTTKTSNSQKKATIKYAKNNLKRIPLDVQLDEYEKLKTFALANGYTINGFIKESFREKMKKIENNS